LGNLAVNQESAIYADCIVWFSDEERAMAAAVSSRMKRMVDWLAPSSVARLFQSLNAVLEA